MNINFLDLKKNISNTKEKIKYKINNIIDNISFIGGKNIENLEKKIMNPGDFITINPYTLHRMEGIEDSSYLESSTNELWDVIRLEDKYSRKNETEKDYK